MNNLKKIEDIVQLLETDKLTVQQFQAFFDAIVGVIADMKKMVDDSVTKNKDSVASFCHAETIKLIANLQDAEKRLNKALSTKASITDLKSLSLEIIKKVQVLIPKSADLSPLERRITALENVVPKPIVFETREEIRNKLESFSNENDKLDILAIRDLRKELDDLRTEIKTGTGKGFHISGGAANGGGRIVKIYDLSPLLNGVTKTFSLPSNWRVLAVHASSSPYSAFRPTTDYTSTSSSITFTSQVDETTILAAGQSVLIEYAQ